MIQSNILKFKHVLQLLCLAKYFSQKYFLPKYFQLEYFQPKYFQQKQFPQKYLSQKYFLLEYFLSKYFLLKYFLRRYYLPKYFLPKYFLPKYFQPKYFVVNAAFLFFETSKLLNYGFYLCIFCRQMESRRTKIERFAKGTFRVPLSQTFHIRKGRSSIGR